MSLCKTPKVSSIRSALSVFYEARAGALVTLGEKILDDAERLDNLPRNVPPELVEKLKRRLAAKQARARPPPICDTG